MSRRAESRRVRLPLTGILALMLTLACSAPQRTSSTGSAPAQADAANFSFVTPDGQLLRSEDLRGRVTILLFVTTFDLISQEQAKRLEDHYRTHAPRINAVAVVLEAPRYAQLAESFGPILGLNYPVVMADHGTLSGVGPFGQVHSVPTWVFVDKKGRLGTVYRGQFTASQLEDLTRRHQ